ncbi:MAG: pilus assembly protein [Desulfotignum sp.]|nr:pilus assembly protein [Desulfotignum sp.]
MNARLLNPAGNEKGATAVEFAIVLPLLLLVVFGVIEWGLYMYNRQVITNAAREGARYGVLMRKAPREVTNTDEDLAIKARVLEFAETYLVTFGTDKLEEADVIITRTDEVGNKLSEDDAGYLLEDWFEFGSELTIEFDYEYKFLYLSTFIGKLTITGASTMRME